MDATDLTPSSNGGSRLSPFHDGGSSRGEIAEHGQHLSVHPHTECCAWRVVKNRRQFSSAFSDFVCLVGTARLGQKIHRHVAHGAHGGVVAGEQMFVRGVDVDVVGVDDSLRVSQGRFDLASGTQETCCRVIDLQGEIRA